MVVEVLAADAGTGVGVGIVAPTKDADARDIGRQEIAKPVDAIIRGPMSYHGGC